MSKFTDLYKMIIEEVEDGSDAVFQGVIIDPDRQSIEPFEYTISDIQKIRADMKEPQEDDLNSIPGTTLLFDDRLLEKNKEFIFSVYDEPDDIPVAGVGYIINKTDYNQPITVDQIKPIVRFGSAEELI